MSTRLCLATTDKRRTAMRAQLGVRSSLRGGFAASRPLALAAGKATGLRVVLVGWLGAQPKYLAKYTELWEQQGATVVPYIPPMTAALFPAQADRSAAHFARVMEQHNASSSAGEQDTVYHVFSNGGFLFLSAVLLNQKRGAICKNLVGGEPKGIIVDSAPGDITPDMAARGFGAAALKTHSDGFGDSFRLGVQAARATFGAYLNLPPIKRRMQEVRDVWLEKDAPLCPQLYLYSGADDLIPDADVERHMQRQEERGVKVHHRKWDDTVHVEHYRKYPTTYLQELRRFTDHELQVDGLRAFDHPAPPSPTLDAPVEQPPWSAGL